MSKLTEFTIEKRQLSGRKTHQLRVQGIIPAVVYGKGMESISVQMELLSFQKIFDQVGETGVINLKIQGQKETYPVMIKLVDRHPVTGDILHVDFHKVDLKMAINAVVPIEFVGESPAVKDLGAIIIPQRQEIEVEALPTDIPEKFEVSLESLMVLGDQLTLADLVVPVSVKLIDPLDTVIVVAQSGIQAEEVETVEPVETEVIAKGKAEEESVEGETESTNAPAN